MMTPVQKNFALAIASFAVGALAVGAYMHSRSEPTPVIPNTPIPDTVTPTTTPNPVSADIQITSPLANTVVTSPLTLTGQAIGTWFFEASFPITLVDENGRTIAGTHAEALSDWMTTSSVPFSATLTFTPSPTVQHGFIVFQKDNPSGLPENSGEFRLPVTF